MTVSDLDELRGRWSSCQAAENQKDNVVADLFKHIDDLSGKLKQSESDLRDKTDLAAFNRDRADKIQNEVKSLKATINSNAFALVLIDGDCMPFTDELVSQGFDGGTKAAVALNRAVQAHLASSLPESPHVKVVIRVYASVKGMSKTYRELELTPAPASFDEFVRAFNMSGPLCDLIDAGTGKECSDDKLKGMFDLHKNNVHCQKILFGGSADNGYARLLMPCLNDEALRARITLIEGPPFEKELAAIKGSFGVVAFDDVFRKQKLQTVQRRVSFHLTPPPTPVPVANYATAAAKRPPTPPAVPPQAPPAGATAAKILRNQLGHRIDAQLEYSADDFARLLPLKLCNTYHILGTCSHIQRYGNCHHEHGEQLSQRNVQALRAIARLSPCHWGLSCTNPDCIHGHRCTLGHRCPRENGSPSSPNCRFSADMHDVDTRVVSTVML